MNKEFRVWDSDSNKYLTCFTITMGGEVATQECDWDHPRIMEGATLEQWTGLFDKNEVKIFEGDIANEIFKGEYRYVDTLNQKRIISIVKDDDCNPSLLLHRQNVKYDYDIEYDFVQCGLLELEIIGNIHENAELIRL